MTLKSASPAERRELLSERLASAKVKLAIISDPRHVYYLTGFLTYKPRLYSFLLLDPKDVTSTLVMGDSDKPRSKLAQVDEVATFADYEIEHRMVGYADFVSEELAKVVKAKLGGRAGPKPTVGIEEWHLAVRFADSIGRALGSVRYHDLSSSLLKMRMIKSREEVDLVEKAARRLDLTYETAAESIRQGVTENDVYNDMNSTICARFGAPNFGERPTLFGDVISGERCLDISGAPTSRKLKKHETVILDLATPCDNYWADTSRVFFVGGKPTPAQLGVYNAVLAAKKAAENLLRPGSTGADVYWAAANSLKNSGYAHSLPHHAGHGMGLEDQEAPWFLPNSKERLAEGMVCALEPGIYRRQEGGMRVEDNYVITKDGFRTLSRYPVEY